MASASGALQAAAVAALRPLMAVYDGPPLQAAFPYAVVEAGPETDWSHKTGEGREARIAILVRDAGERPERLRTLMETAQAAVDGIAATEGWQIVTLHFLRGRVARETKNGWAGAIDYRARMLRLA